MSAPCVVGFGRASSPCPPSVRALRCFLSPRLQRCPSLVRLVSATCPPCVSSSPCPPLVRLVSALCPPCVVGFGRASSPCPPLVRHLSAACPPLVRHLSATCPPCVVGFGRAFTPSPLLVRLVSALCSWLGPCLQFLFALCPRLVGSCLSCVRRMSALCPPFVLGLGRSSSLSARCLPTMSAFIWSGFASVYMSTFVRVYLYVEIFAPRSDALSCTFRCSISGAATTQNVSLRWRCARVFLYVNCDGRDFWSATKWRIELHFSQTVCWGSLLAAAMWPPGARHRRACAWLQNLRRPCASTVCPLCQLRSAMHPRLWPLSARGLQWDRAVASWSIQILLSTAQIACLLPWHSFWLPNSAFASAPYAWKTVWGLCWYNFLLLSYFPFFNISFPIVFLFVSFFVLSFKFLGFLRFCCKQCHKHRGLGETTDKHRGLWAPNWPMLRTQRSQRFPLLVAKKHQKSNKYNEISKCFAKNNSIRFQYHPLLMPANFSSSSNLLFRTILEAKTHNVRGLQFGSCRQQFADHIQVATDSCNHEAGPASAGLSLN